MTIYSIIDVNGNIISRAVGPDNTDWPPPTDCTVVQEGDIPFQIGGTYVNGVYTQPVQPAPFWP